MRQQGFVHGRSDGEQMAPNRQIQFRKNVRNVTVNRMFAKAKPNCDASDSNGRPAARASSVASMRRPIASRARARES
jgi:hypothetical protein